MITIFNRKLLCRNTSESEHNRVKAKLYKNAIEYIECTCKIKKQEFNLLYVLRRDWATALGVTGLDANKRAWRGIIWIRRRKSPV